MDRTAIVAQLRTAVDHQVQWYVEIDDIRLLCEATAQNYGRQHKTRDPGLARLRHGGRVR